MHSPLNFSRLFITVLNLLPLLNASPTSLTIRKPAPPTVTVKNGTYAGIFSPTYSQDFFLGIPFALPPLGALRFRAPQSLSKKFSGIHQATEYAPECIGYGGDDIGYPESEDCLYLNVIRPAGVAEDAKLPVAVWIHGGGLEMGGTRDLRYNLTFIVQNSVEIGQPMIAVGIAYRLSAWGFLGGKQALEAGATNVGFRDQRLALHWLNENINAFGGDKDKVTIWGESAGAQSVGSQLLAFGGRDDGLFRAAIAESGGPAVDFFYSAGPGYNSTAYQTSYDTLLNSTGCDTLNCLRGLPFNTINDALNISTNGLGPFGPAIDGDFIQTYPSEQLAKGEFVKVPFLIGTNADEGTAFGSGFGPGGQGVNTDEEFRQAIAEGGPDNETITILEALYPNIPALGIPAEATYSGPENFEGSQFKRVAAFFGDAVVVGPRRATNIAWATFNTTSFSYRWNVLVSTTPAFIGATHFGEVAFVFDNIDGLGYAENEFQGEPASYITLATQMTRSWVGFITELDPNKNGLEGVNTWPEYVLEGGVGQNFVLTAEGDGSQSFAEVDDFRAEGIAFISANAKSQFGR